MSDMRERYRRLLAEHGLENNGHPHSWRCDYPDRYGSCDCVEVLLTDLVVAANKLLREQEDA